MATISIVMVHGVFRVHGSRCRDVAREATRYNDDPWTFDAETRHEINLACWGDVASDHFSPEAERAQWEALCDEYAASETTYLPCCPVKE